ncbi:MAG: replicative DNA helicase [Nigerium sp.]|nr:replicative DNA helicase [Nigerium sp.]
MSVDQRIEWPNDAVAFERSPSPGDRTPPQDLAAEKSALGAMLLSKDAIGEVTEVLKGRDFYRPAHEFIFDSIMDLYGSGEPVDAITVGDLLGKRGQLAQVGGPIYLHDLVSSVSVTANAVYYAEIIRDKAILRRLVDASMKISQMGYQAEGDVTQIVDRAQQAIYEVAENRTVEDYQPLSELVEVTLDEIEALTQHGQMAGVPTGFIDLDHLTNGLHSGQMIIIAARPGMGKSTLGLDFARAASIRNGLCSVFFSLEMTKSEIVMRLMSAESGVPLNAIRKGDMNEEYWQRISNKTAQVSRAPLFIDDSPNLTMMEIRAKARRLKQRHDLKLVVIDYMQLMTSGKKVESRQIEVSEFSRQIKLLAKELEVPVVALSQLNRGPESRQDKKPMLSDLRESGCLTADTRVLRADTGAEATMGELLASGERNVPVWSLDSDRRLVARPMTHVFSSGVKQVFRLRLASGREVKASANHPFLTYEGWVPLGELTSGTRVAIPRRVPEPLRAQRRDEDEIVLTAHLLGDAADHEKSVPAWVFGLPRDQVALFLRQLWATDGSVRSGAAAGQGGVRHVSTSRRLADDVMRLLGRFGIVARLETVRKTGFRDGCHVVVDGVIAQRVFWSEIGVRGARGAAVEEVLEHLENVATTHPGAVPAEARTTVSAEVVGAGMVHRRFAAATDTRSCDSAAWKRSPSRERLARAAQVVGSADLECEASGDVHWDAVISIDLLGEEEVFDATVLGTHNFVADGVAVHNSLEQDADVVILLHREDAYDKQSERAGEADFIIAKHRNGATDTLPVAFQGALSRFVDMQR